MGRKGELGSNPGSRTPNDQGWKVRRLRREPLKLRHSLSFLVSQKGSEYGELCCEVETSGFIHPQSEVVVGQKVVCG